MTKIVFLAKVPGRQRVQALGQVHVALVGNDLMAGVGEVIELILDGSDHPRVAVAGVEDGNAGREVDIAATFPIPDLGIFGAIGIDLRGHRRRRGKLQHSSGL